MALGKRSSSLDRMGSSGMSTPKRLRWPDCAGSPGEDSPLSWVPKPEGCSPESCAVQQQSFPALEPGIVSTILESCHGNLSQAHSSLLRFCNVCGISGGGGAPPTQFPASPAPPGPAGLKCRKRQVPFPQGGRTVAPSLGESLPLEEWSDPLVRQLHGCPSVDEAKARVRRLLETWTNEAALAGQQAALNSNFVDPTHPEEENCPSEDGDGTMMRDEGDAERPPCGSSSSSSSSVSFS